MPTTRDQLAAHLQSATTTQLAEVLAVLAAKELRSEPERRAQSEIIGELCRRHPEINEALERWCDTLENAELSQAEMTLLLIPTAALES